MKETAKFVKYTVSNKNNYEWEEEIEIPYCEDIDQFIQKMISNWNDEEKRRKEINPNYPVDVRKIISINSEVMGESQKQKISFFQSADEQRRI